MSSTTMFWSAGIGFFLGFAFGVGCALAVMYSIYMGGYRAAVRDSRLAEPPERYRHTLDKLTSAQPAGLSSRISHALQAESSAPAPLP